MQVKVANRMYRMSRNEFEGLLKVASEQVPFGIYAVEHEKNGYAELRCDKCKSMSQLKKLTRQFKTAGYKVYTNKQVLKETAEGALMSAT